LSEFRMIGHHSVVLDEFKCYLKRVRNKLSGLFAKYCSLFLTCCY